MNMQFEKERKGCFKTNERNRRGCLKKETNKRNKKKPSVGVVKKQKHTVRDEQQRALIMMDRRKDGKLYGVGRLMHV